MPAGGAWTQRLSAIQLSREEAAMSLRSKAKAEGKYKGRKPTAMQQADEIKRLAGEGVGATEISKRLGIGRASVYRALGAQN